jgi:hypothetical protein
MTARTLQSVVRRLASAGASAERRREPSIRDQRFQVIARKICGQIATKVAKQFFPLTSSAK